MKRTRSKILCLTLIFLVSASLASAQEKRFSFQVELYENGSEPVVESDIIESSQLTPFSSQGNYNFTLESGGQVLDFGTKSIGFEIKGPTASGEPYVEEIDSRTVQMYFPLNQEVETFNIYSGGEKLKEVNLSVEICQNTPCEEYCWDQVENSTLRNCENYDGFNQTGDSVDSQEEETFDIKYILLALAPILLLLIYYINNRRIKE